MSGLLCLGALLACAACCACAASWRRRRPLPPARLRSRAWTLAPLASSSPPESRLSLWPHAAVRCLSSDCTGGAHQRPRVRAGAGGDRGTGRGERQCQRGDLDEITRRTNRTSSWAGCSHWGPLRRWQFGPRKHACCRTRLWNRVDRPIGGSVPVRGVRRDPVEDVRTRWRTTSPDMPAWRMRRSTRLPQRPEATDHAQLGVNARRSVDAAVPDSGSRRCALRRL